MSICVLSIIRSSDKTLELIKLELQLFQFVCGIPSLKYNLRKIVYPRTSHVAEK